MEDADQSSTSNGRSSHNVGRLGTLIRVIDNTFLTLLLHFPTHFLPSNSFFLYVGRVGIGSKWENVFLLAKPSSCGLGTLMYWDLYVAESHVCYLLIARLLIFCLCFCRRTTNFLN